MGTATPDTSLHPLTDEIIHRWDAMMAVLGCPNDRKNRDFIRKLHRLHASPIIFPKRGSQPCVLRTALLRWWAELRRRLGELQEERAEQEVVSRDQRLSVQDTYAYGRQADVVPEIAGHYKRRRNQSATVS